MTRVTVYFFLFVCLFLHEILPILTLRWGITQNKQHGKAKGRVFVAKKANWTEK